MKRPGICAVIAAFAVAAGGTGFGAGVPKLKPVVSGYLDARGGGLRQPEGVACDGRSRVVVADTGNARLVEYAFDREALSPRAEFALPQLPCPTRVRLGPGGVIFALDGKLRKIVRISPSGEFSGYVEAREGESASPMVPKSFGFDRNGNLYVLDVLSARVLVLAPDGRIVRAIDYPAGVGFLSDIAVEDSGLFYLVDSVGKKVFSAPPDSGTIAALPGGLDNDVAFPASIAADGRGNLLVVDQNGGGIVVLGRDGAFRGRQSGMGWREGLLRYPAQICAGADGYVFVADRGNSRVQVFRSIE